MSFLERETEILKVLGFLIQKRLDLILVGGYAVSSHARHRYSVDCDLVVQKKDLEEFGRALKQNGFEKYITKDDFDQTYGGEFVNYKKKVNNLPVTFDLLVNSLVSRTTDAAWSYEYIKKHSKLMLVPGIETSLQSRVSNRELLIAFKIHSGRRTDIRDIIMLQANTDLKNVMTHLKRGNITALITQIAKINHAFEDEKLINSLKSVFSLAGDVEKQIRNAKKFMQQILNNLKT